jgi:multidrug efflux pump subunit AcrA (membrane-fusion protein)
VLAQSAVIGQHVEPGTELFRLAGSRGSWLELQAPARNSNAIRVGDIVSIAGCDSPGRVIGVGSQLDPESQTFMVRAEIDDAACVRPNQYVEADVLPGSVPAGLVSVPASALVRNANRDYVFVEKDGVFSPVPVIVERRHGDIAWLRGGVPAGARVAAAGVTALKGAWLGFGPAVEASGGG